MGENFPWYDLVNDLVFEQGHLLNNFPILIQPDEIPLPEAMTSDEEDIKVNLTISSKNLKLHNVIIMTQSCDFTKGLKDDDLVTLCARFDYKDAFPGKEKSLWLPVIEGRVVGSHLLNKCELEGFNFEYQIVDLSQIFSVPYSALKKIASTQSPRVRLLPPYREHLAQTFARRFMRVGLPIDLPRDYPYK